MDQIDTLEIRNTDPTPGGVQLMNGFSEGVLKIVNNLDEDVTVVLQATTFDDKTFDLPYVRDEVVVLAGERGYLRVGESWVYVRPMATCAIAPTIGALKMVWDFK